MHIILSAEYTIILLAITVYRHVHYCINYGEREVYWQSRHIMIHDLIIIIIKVENRRKSIAHRKYVWSFIGQDKSQFHVSGGISYYHIFVSAIVSVV